MHSCVCSYFTADVAFTSTTYQPLSKKVQKFQEVFLFFFVFSKISRSCYFLSLLLLMILNLKNYRVARKTATKIFSNTRETNFLWQQDDPFTIVKGYICNYRYGFQKLVMHRKTIYFLPVHEKTQFNFRLAQNKYFQPLLPLTWLNKNPFVFRVTNNGFYDTQMCTGCLFYIWFHTVYL